jgi:acyl-CoA synthetase (AMP-forming)/AMP-acid ligase II
VKRANLFDPMLAREQIHQALAGTGPAVLISSSAKFDPESESFKSLLSEMTAGAEQIAILSETSGSSGAPKLVALSAQAINYSAKVTNQFLGAEIGDRWSLTLPLNHIAGINQLTRSINLETSPAPSDGEGAQFISVVPTQLHRAIQNKDSFFNNLLAAKKVLVGGAPISEKLIDESDPLCKMKKEINDGSRTRKNIINVTYIIPSTIKCCIIIRFFDSIIQYIHILFSKKFYIS